MCFQNAKWIWSYDCSHPNSRVLFRQSFSVDEIPQSAALHIAADTKYYLYINGALAVFDGGLFRESTKGNGWYDCVELAPYLKKGENLLALMVWYFGNGGRNNSDSGRAGVIFECPALGLHSGSCTGALPDPSAYETETENPSYIYGGHNYAADGRLALANWEQPDYAGAVFPPAQELGAYPCAPWNLCLKRPIPLFAFSAVTELPFTQNENVYTVILPYAMQATPYLRIRASEGTVVDIRSDRYWVQGGPGYPDRYPSHRAEYICRAGEQEFEALDWQTAEKFIFTVHGEGEILSLGFRESCYPTKILPQKSTDPLIQTLLEKSARTLKLCMRENFMDCPDRERGQWIGDVSVQAAQVFYALDQNAVPLLRKAVLDTVRLRRGKDFVCNIPGICNIELPGHCLNAISEYGLIAIYYEHTKDVSVLAEALPACYDYLMQWNMLNGLPELRSGDWQWFDHWYNIDEKVLNTCWYYSALKFALEMAQALQDHRFDDELTKRKESIEAHFDEAFWNGRYYSSGSFVDDRACALAVISGLAGTDKYEALTLVLGTVYHATPYMEYYCLEALCQMNQKELCLRRMISRYYPLIVNENSTLWEDFWFLGTKNHAWSGGPLTIIHKYFPELLEKTL